MRSVPCPTERCKNICGIKKTKCNTCASREWRKANPIRSTLNNLKHKAKRRGKPFDISLREFTFFCHTTGYIDNKGNKAEAASLDRIKNHLGYTLDNLQVLLVGENVQKQRRLEQEIEPDPF